MNVRIRDFLQSVDGWIFAVVDYYHSQGIRCILRYVPDSNGERTTNGVRYRKLDFDQSFEFLRRAKLEYVQDVHVVPEDDILRLYKPEKELIHVAEEDSRVNKIVTILKEGGVSQESMGITGSMLIGLQGLNSDIDFVVYGNDWWKARDLITRAKEEGLIQDLDKSTWKKIYTKRVPEISYEEFVAHEKRKGNRGLVDGTYFDLLFTRDWDQITAPYLPGTKIGRRKIVAKVTEAEFAFDNPAVFKIEHQEIDEIHCYTHTYTGQALPGEIVEANGVVEETETGLRLVVGTTREAKGEWIRSLTLLEKATSIS
ncbi:MAG: nucleotidyltransferase domain-containing protein [Methanotrichaceae archaeon]